MKVAVIGSRTFTDKSKLFTTLSNYDISLIVSGGARGADSISELYATENKIPTKIFYPDWNKHGKAAGFIRNKDIIDNCDIVVAFWDGESKGTLHSINLAKKSNKQVDIILY